MSKSTYLEDDPYWMETPFPGFSLGSISTLPGKGEPEYKGRKVRIGFQLPENSWEPEKKRRRKSGAG